jgi:predicted permease
MLTDLRYALRALGRTPGFVLVAVLCVALGVGVNVSVFSMVNALVVRALPFPEPDRVLMLYTARPSRGEAERMLSVAELVDVRARARTLAAVAGMYGRNVNLAGVHETERVEAQAVTHDLLPLVGVRPALGRHFRADEDRPGAAKVVILSDGLWRRRFDARPDIVGRAVLLNGAPHTVVGVMPPRFAFPLTSQLWVPMGTDPTEARDSRYVWTVARLRPGAALDAARTELAALGRQFAAEHPGPSTGWELLVKPLAAEFVEPPLRLMLALLSGAVGMVVLIVCANLANLMLARATGRRRELALRAAIGARRARLVRLLLTESLVVSLLGGALGVGVAWAWNRSLLASIPEEMPYWMRIEIDATVLAYAVGLSVLTGALFGTLPALRASRPNLSGALKDGGRTGQGRGRARLRGALVTAQVALAVVLLVGAGLVVRTFVNMRLADVGVDAPHLLTLRTFLAGDRYATPAARALLQERLAQRLEALPGVRRAAAVSALPSDDGGVTATLFRESAAGDEMTITAMNATAGAFEALGAPVVRGREFTARESADTQATVAIVNRALAERLWPRADALGRTVRMAVMGEDTLTFTVVGVAPDLVYQEIGEQSPPDRWQVYLPYARMAYRGVTVVVRTTGEPGALASAARRELRALDPTLPAYDVRTMDEVRRYGTWPNRLYGQLFGAFGGLALVLAALGVYGIMAYAVAQRRHEIGVRLALGARADDVARAFVRDAARLALPGVAIGLLVAAALSRLAAGALYGVSPIDPATFVAVPLLILAVALLAVLLPARRAARVDPLVALRTD